MRALTHRSVAGIRIEGLARTLGIAKAGFYWHFKNREDYIAQLLQFWLEQVTKAVTHSPALLAMEPKERLVAAARKIHDDDLTQAEASIQLLAIEDKSAASVVRQANKLRLAFASDALAALGFKGDDLKMRAMLFVGYHSWESMQFRDTPRKRRRELIERRIDLLTDR